MVVELSSGPFLAMEIGHENENKHTYSEFRKLCGPIDPVSQLNNIINNNQLSINIVNMFSASGDFSTGYRTPDPSENRTSQIWSESNTKCRPLYRS